MVQNMLQSNRCAQNKLSMAGLDRYTSHVIRKSNLTTCLPSCLKIKSKLVGLSRGRQLLTSNLSFIRNVLSDLSGLIMHDWRQNVTWDLKLNKVLSVRHNKMLNIRNNHFMYEMCYGQHQCEKILIIKKKKCKFN